MDTLSDLEESRVKSILFDSLEQFIAGKEDVQSVFSKLTESDTPPAVCGHVFKPGGMISDIFNSDMKFVQNFTHPDFQAKNFTPQKCVNCEIFLANQQRQCIKYQ